MEAAMAITALFAADDVVLDVNTGNKRSLLEFLAAEAASRIGLSSDEVLDALKAREKLGSTGLGKGIALPHAELQKDIAPLMLFARLRRAIDFGAQDEEPVDLVFLVLWPTTAVKDLLPTMSEICRILREPQTLRDLRLARTPERIVQVLQQWASFDSAQGAPSRKD
jgi:PTS system nitrogen regulatory IIA component